MKIPRAILFDSGGVLCELRGEAHMLKLLGGSQTREQMWRTWLASPAVRAHESGQLSEMEFAKQVVVEFALDIAPKAYLIAFRDWIIGPFPGALDLLSHTKERYQTALLSNIGCSHWPSVEAMDLLPRVHHAFPSFKLGAVKPDQQYFQRALNAMNISPEEAIFLMTIKSTVMVRLLLALRRIAREGWRKLGGSWWSLVCCKRRRLALCVFWKQFTLTSLGPHGVRGINRVSINCFRNKSP